MSATLQRSSWHPAFMPNSLADLDPPEPTESSIHKPIDRPSLESISERASWHPAFMPNSLAKSKLEQSLATHDPIEVRTGQPFDTPVDAPSSEHVPQPEPWKEREESSENEIFSNVVPRLASKKVYSEPPTVQEISPVPKPENIQPIEPLFEHLQWEESKDSEFVLKDTLGKKPATLETKSNEDHPELGNLRAALETSLASPGGVEMEDNPMHNSSIAQPDTDFITDGSHSSKADFPTKGPVTELARMSSASFARTIPRDMDWGEDNEVDPEWNLQRSDDNFFKMTAARDGTNSFPEVPGAKYTISGSEISLQEDQQSAEPFRKDLFEENENNDDFFPNLAEPDIQNSNVSHSREEEWLNNHGGQTIDEDFERSYGGDAGDPSDFEARYGEGLPLLGDDDADLSASKEQNASPVLFEDEDPSREEDFFSSIRNVGSVDQESVDQEFSHQKKLSMERKSTIQITNSLQFPSSDHQLLPVGPVPEDSPIAENTFALPSEEDLAAKWKAAIDGDDLLDDEDLLDDDTAPETTSLDPATFFGSDDEGFLEDEPSSYDNQDQISLPVTETNGQHPGFDSVGASRLARTDSASRYFPPNAIQSQPSELQPTNQYKPVAPLIGDFSKPIPLPVSSPYGPGYGSLAPSSSPSFGATPQPARPENSKSQSFADKSKGGYSSPYDLPMEVVKPRKRTSMQQLSRGYNNAAPVVASPRSASMYTQAPPPSRGSQVPPPSREPNSSLLPPAQTQQLPESGQLPQIPSGTPAITPILKSKASFFEELPMKTKSKSAGRYTPQPVSPVDPRAYQGNAPYSPMGRMNAPPHSFDPRATHGIASYQSGHASAPPESFDPQVTQRSTPYPLASPANPISQSFDPRVTKGGAYAPSALARVPSPVADSRATDGNAPYAPPNLVAPAKIIPYANLSRTPPQSITPSSRYAPSPSQTASGSHFPPVVAQGRYASAPTNLRQVPTQTPVQPSIPLPHQPRTSSPLAHFERSQDHQSYGGPATTAGGITMLRKGSSGFDHLSRAASLPVTKEVEEQEINDNSSFPPQNRRPSHQYQLNHANSEISQHAQEYQHGGNLSPSNRSISGYGPNGGANQESAFAPPQRSQTQSPGRVMAGPRPDMSATEPLQRPISVNGPASAKQISNANSSIRTTMTEEAPKTRTRGFSQGYHYIAPTDGRERDLLQRWRGGPIFAWGVGGTVAMSFPKEVPRYGMGQVQPQIMVSPGEVKIRNLKDLYPLEERLASFPGPLKSKAKKRETITWLATGIDILDGENDHLRSLTSLSHEDKRKEERVILWKILRVMIENDGLLEGNEAVNSAVRSVLLPGLDNDVNGAAQNTTGPELTGIYRDAGSITQADSVNSVAVDQIRKFLFRGEREKAVWEAVDKRLWAHAMLISNAVSRDLYKQVAQEFIQKEVKSIGENTESIAALYEVFAGNFEESVDVLVPPSARAGFQMVSASGSGPSRSSLDGLDRWRETLGLILSNRSENDGQAINALGKLLSGYGRAEAAHICFIFARKFSEFSGVDNPLSDIVLVGSDHLRQRHEFDQELEPILLSEAYEFGLTLSNTSNTPLSIPHLAVYKLQHATILAQFGQREKALQYCEAIDASIYSQTRRSPYHNALLESALTDLRARLKASPKDESSSWISKPSIDKVSTSVWSKFNKFVAGDENDTNAAPGSEAGSDIGPFSRIAGGTPTLSRPPSGADLYGSYNGGPPNGAIPPPPATTAASRYAPGTNYNPATTPNDPPISAYGSPPQLSSFDQRRSTEEPRTLSREASVGTNQGGSLYAAQRNQNSSPTYSPYAPLSQASYGSSQPETPTYDQPTSHMHQSPQYLSSSEKVPQSINYGVLHSYDPNASGPTPRGQNGYGTPPTNPYEPPSTIGYNITSDYDHGRPISTGYEPPSFGYEPPLSSGYEPPSYEPNMMNDELDSPIDTTPKKKTFMDDDDDQPDSQPREKTKAEKDREADEAFRKAAEADAQKDAAAPEAKKGWGLGGWFGGSKKGITESPQPNKAIKAKLGENSSFVYDPELKRWVNKKASKDGTPEIASSTPPPPKGPPKTASLPPGIAPTYASQSNILPSNGSAPPQRAASAGRPPGTLEGGHENLLIPPAMRRTISSGSIGPPSGPPSRPSTSMSNASSIDDLLGPPAARKGGAKKAKKGRGYIDVMGEKK